MPGKVHVDVTREELRVISSWLEFVGQGSNVEHHGGDDKMSADASAALADYCEQEGERGADIVAACRCESSGGKAPPGLPPAPRWPTHVPSLALPLFARCASGVPVLVEAVLEMDSQRMLEALMAAVAGALPVRKASSFL